MSIRVDKVQLEIEVREHRKDAELVKLNKQLGEAGRKYRSLQNEVDKLADKEAKNGKLTQSEAAELAGLKTQLEKAEQEYRKFDRQKTQYVKDNKLETMTIHELSQEYRQYQMLLKNLSPNSEYYKQTQDYLDALKNRMSELNRRTIETKNSLQKFAESFNHFAFAITNALAIKDRIVSWAQQYVDAFAKMDDAMTDVMKYTGQTKREVEEMNETFKQMTTRTAREELNALAGVAGRLGITARKDIEGFVDAADKINVALGDDLGEGAIDQIGKLTMVFGEDKTKGLNGAMLATGSAINVLGASSSANTGFITEFTSSMAGMAVNAGIAQTDIMGYASALSQAGIEGQTASGVFAQMITKMFTDPARFAKAARLDVKQFTDLLKTDANKAILQFLEGLKQNGGFDALAPALKSLKMQGTQAVPVISSLINKMDELRKAQKTAREAYDEGTSIIDEFNNANSSAAARLEIARKRMNDAAVTLGQQLMPIVETSITAGTITLKLISSLVSFTIQYRTQLLSLAAAVATLTAMWRAHTVWQTIVDARTKVMTASNKMLTASMTLLRTAGVALHATWALLTKGIAGYTAVMRAARLASLTNPWTALATVLTVVGVAVYGMVKAWQTHAQALREQDPAWRAAKAHAQDMAEVSKRVNQETAREVAQINHLTTVIRSNAYSIGERRTAIKQLQDIVPGYHASITNEGRLIEENTGKLEDYIKQLRATARAQAYMDRLADIEAKKLDNELRQRRKQNNLKAVDAELQRGQRMGDKNPYRSVKIDAATSSLGTYTPELEGNTRLIAKLEERKVHEDALNEAKREGVALARQQQLLEEQMAKDGVVREVVAKGNKPASPASVVTGNTDADTEDEKGRKEREARQKKERKDAEARLKAQHDEDMLALKQEWQDKLTTDAEYHQKRFVYESEYLENLAKLREQYGASEADRQEVADKSLDLIISETNRQREQRQRDMQEELRTAEMSYNADVIEIERSHLNGLYNTEREYQDKKLEAERDYQQQRIDIIRKYGGDATAEQQKIDQLELQQTRTVLDRKVKEYEQAYRDISQQQVKSPADFDTLRSLTMSAWEQHLVSYEEYQKRMTDIAQTETDQRTRIQQEAVQAGQQLLSSASSLFSALQSRETAQVDAKYKKLIAAAKKQGKDTTKLEEQQEAEKMAIQKKYAQKQFRLQVLQIIAATAQSIANVWKMWAGTPAVAAALSAVAAAQGAIQLATAKAQADQAAGLYQGGYSDDYLGGDVSPRRNTVEGYTRRGSDPKKQAGFIPVHQNEFVANHRAVANPEVRPVLDVIDRHQRLGDISMLNATRLLDEAYGRGRYQGGYTGDHTSPAAGEAGSGSSPTGTSLTLSSDDRRLLEAIERNTARSLTVRTLRDEIAHEELLERNAHR